MMVSSEWVIQTLDLKFGEATILEVVESPRASGVREWGWWNDVRKELTDWLALVKEQHKSLHRLLKINKTFGPIDVFSGALSSSKQEGVCFQAQENICSEDGELSSPSKVSDQRVLKDGLQGQIRDFDIRIELCVDLREKNSGNSNNFTGGSIPPTEEIPSQDTVVEETQLAKVGEVQAISVKESIGRESSPFAVANVNSSSVSSYRTYNSGKAKGERPICAYCGITGHTKDKCYKLHGFPPGFKFRNGNGRSSSNVSAHSNFKPSINQTSSDVIEAVPSQFTPSNAVTGLSSNQCQQLIALLSSKLHTTSSADSHHVVSNFTGIDTSIPSTTWIIDNGATHHVCHDLSLFSSFDIDFSESSVQLPNGHMVAISKIGTVSLSLHLVLTKVLYVPDFKYNLLSISALLQSASCSLKFYDDHCYIQDISQDSLIGMGKKIGNLYYLQLPDKNPHAYSVCIDTPITDITLWHYRLGHPSCIKSHPLDKNLNF
ncbi:hypothetical protein LWI29_020955 [Acer saccharum]|uniref:Retrovirus-related Pol polyprotein from transposon TNT 1-94-like beta-barrel domain-containing protein n=1 Tax=Acer saccharum TaxID=4024 RepID=A0AA39W010_ACESA|nr:hypothetical protein LWI29_020955 [Acer saccharum]